MEKELGVPQSRENGKVRGTRVAIEAYDMIILQKSTNHLRPTYQIRLNLYRAIKENTRLVLKVSEDCVFSSKLQKLIDQHSNFYVIRGD